MAMVEIVEAQPGQAASCGQIMRLLPEWFGIEDAIVHYTGEIDKLPTLVAWQDHYLAGFLSIKQHSECAAEIYVMAVHPRFHRHGIGRQLVQAAEAQLRQRGVEYLQVKTLGRSRPCRYYDRTRAFYQSVGFKPLEEFHDLWEGKPCLQMVKCLAGRQSP